MVIHYEIYKLQRYRFQHYKTLPLQPLFHDNNTKLEESEEAHCTPVVVRRQICFHLFQLVFTHHPAQLGAIKLLYAIYVVEFIYFLFFATFVSPLFFPANLWRSIVGEY